MLVAIAVAIASGIGGLARYGISNLVHGDDLPWATLAINVAGSFLLGALIVVPAAWMSEQVRTALGVGFLGGFTTFSTFSVQAFLDFESGAWGLNETTTTEWVGLGRAIEIHGTGGTVGLYDGDIGAFPRKGNGRSPTDAGVVAFSKALSKQLIGQGVRVNAVAPGPFWTVLQPSGGQTQEKVQHFGEHSAFGRPGQPAEIAPVYVLLASQEASFITGEVYGVTGGAGVA